jgi:thiol-disulfide isomerase/thioredoxin
MLRKILFLCASILFFGCNQASSDPVIQDTQGRSVQLSALKGKWVIVNYWATWCDLCKEEIPALNHFALTHAKKNVVLYGVNYDNLPLAELKKALLTEKITFPVLVGKGWELGEVDVLPTTFIINPAGVMVKTLIGPTTEKTLENIIKV